MIEREEMLVAPLPIFFIRLENKLWLPVHRDLIVMWLRENTGGWFYYDGASTYVFEKDADRLVFKLWIADDPVSRDIGELQPPA